MIDVSGSFATQLGHSYEGVEFIRDLRALTLHDTPAGTGARRGLERREVGRSIFRGRAAAGLRYYQLESR